MEEKKPKKNALNIIIAILLIIIGVLLFLLLSPQISKKKNRDPNARLGQYEGKSQEEIQAELNRIVEEGMFNISINPNVTLENGEAEADLRIENIAANHHLMSVVITLDETGEQIYSSGLIEPGYHIQTAPLSRPLKKGYYSATAVFTAYYAEDEKPAGQAAVKINIEVKK
ncbi:MAG: hypothetical protein GX061_07075 [Eubacteriaceae bacterium]|nr:hypothetical protein [Eubacteriaceae bacterium]